MRTAQPLNNVEVADDAVHDGVDAQQQASHRGAALGGQVPREGTVMRTAQPLDAEEADDVVAHGVERQASLRILDSGLKKRLRRQRLQTEPCFWGLWFSTAHWYCPLGPQGDV